MPIKKAAVKALRKDRRRQARNQAVLSKLKTITRRVADLLNQQKLEEARSLLSRVAKTYDTAAARGVIHRNTAARYKSRLTRRINRQQAAST